MSNEHGYVEVENGLRLFYCLSGTGPETVIIPGAHGLTADLEPLNKDRKLIFYDQRGRGGSDIDPEESRIWTDYEVPDMEFVRNYFEIDPVSILGWSYMGGVSALYASQYPAYVDRLILMCPVPMRSDASYENHELAESKARTRLDPEAVERLKALKQAGVDVSEPERYCREHNRVYFPQKMGNPEGLRRMRSRPCVYPNEWSHNLSRHWKNHFPPASLERDWRPLAEKIQARTLVVHGMEDLIPIESSQEWASIIPDARLLKIPGVGHFPHLEAPEMFFPAVHGFLNGE